MSARSKSLTLRLPLERYESYLKVAQRRQISFSALVEEALTAIVKEEEYARLYEAFGQLGEDAEEADVEFAVQAQWEVVSGGRPESHRSGRRQERTR